MRLKTLGGLKLEPDVFHRPKPLLLLAYLAVEGVKEKRHLQELFWPEAAAQGSSMRMAISQARKVSFQLLSSDDHTLSTDIENDFAELHQAIRERDTQKLEALYRGEFLQGFSLPDWSAELEEWVYSTREFITARVRSALIQVAEGEASRGHFEDAARWAERAYGQSGEDPEPEELERLYRLLLAGNSPLSGEVKKQAAEYGLELSLLPQEARAKYFVAAPEGSPKPRATPHNLPRSKTSFIGRSPELLKLGRMIAQGEMRLITVLGPGGIGKTRVGLQLAENQLQEDHFPDGVYFVALEALSEAGQIPLALAQALGIMVKNDALAAVKDGIGHKRMLLMLDNFEHLTEEALLVSELLEACPNLSILVTTRERLNLEEEFVFNLEGLPWPQGTGLDLAAAESNDAVRLFVGRAKRARLEFELTPDTLPHVLSICRFVGGSPLGIELAAVWLRSLPIAEIAREIGKIIAGLEAPSRNLGERHQSLRAVFEHSWKLLKPKEQLALARLTVFADGLSREAASQVCDATIPLLTSLVDKSLLRLSPQGRYDFHPLLHQYAAEKLAELAAERQETRAKHSQYFLSLIEASHKAGAHGYTKDCVEEYQNLLAALAWSQEAGQALAGLRLGNALAPFWLSQGYFDEGSHWLATVLAHPAASAPSEERAKALIGASRIATRKSDRALALGYGEEALEIAQNLGLEELTARVFLIFGSESEYRGRLEEGRKHLNDGLALAQKLGHDELAAQALFLLGNLESKWGNYEQSRALLEESLALFRKLGLRIQIAHNLNNLGFMLWLSGDLKTARAYLEEAVTLALAVPDPYFACTARSNLGGVMQDLGDLSSARTLARQALEFRHEHKDKFGLAYSMENFANLAVVQGDVRRATRLWGVAQRLHQEIGSPMPPLWLSRHERFVATARGQLDQAGFESGWQEGRAMDLEEAVKYALEAEPSGSVGTAARG